MTESQDTPARRDRSRRALAALIVFSLLAGLGGWLYARRDLPASLYSGDAIEYASLARRIAAGEGFTVGILYPLELSFGVGADHPSVLRPPGWPIALAGGFALFGPTERVVHGLLLLFFVGTVLVSAGLAHSLAGPVAGAVAALAVATSPAFWLYLIDGASEVPFAFWVTLAFLLVARRVHPVAIGLACGCAYLTRYNGIVVLAAVAPLLLERERRLPIALGVPLGFALVVGPWWIRNALVAGDPFFSFYNLAPWFSPYAKQGFSLNYMIEPDLTSDVAMHPLRKLWIQGPDLLARWPLIGANLAASVGLLLACLRRERVSLGFALVGAAMVLVAALVLPKGRYFAPFVPTMLALGAAGWLRFGGVLRTPALILIVLWPLVPVGPRPFYDETLLRSVMEQGRAAAREGAAETPFNRFEEPARACLTGRPVVLAQHAARLHWETDAITIQMPGRPEVFGRIADEYPVDWIQLEDWPTVSMEAIVARFAPRPDCGEGLYRRRPGWRP